MGDNGKAAVWADIADLVPWDQNPRDNKSAIKVVADSIQRFGFASPIVARQADGMVIAGHTRLEAAKSLGLDRVPVRYLDLSLEDAKMLALADNKLGEIADWDNDMLASIIQDFRAQDLDVAGLGWNEEELDSMIFASALPDTDSEISEEEELGDPAPTCPHCGGVL